MDAENPTGDGVHPPVETERVRFIQLTIKTKEKHDTKEALLKFTNLSANIHLCSFAALCTVKVLKQLSATGGRKQSRSYFTATLASEIRFRWGWTNGRNLIGLTQRPSPGGGRVCREAEK